MQEDEECGVGAHKRARFTESDAEREKSLSDLSKGHVWGNSEVSGGFYEMFEADGEGGRVGFRGGGGAAKRRKMTKA